MPSSTKNLSFAIALEHVKQGGIISRSGWNGKGMFVFMRPGDEIEVGVINNIKSLPGSVKDYFRIRDEKQPGSEQGLEKIRFTPYLCMKAADGSIVNGWLASQTDILSNDWEIIYPYDIA